MSIPERFPEVGERVEILQARHFNGLKHRAKNGKVFGFLERRDGEYLYVRPTWCTWQLELYLCEVKLQEAA